MSKDTDHVVALERKFWSNSNDPAYFEEAMADDGIAVIEPLGFVTKKQAVQYAAQGKPFTNVVMHDLTVRELSPDCVMLAYHGEGTSEVHKEPYRGSICSVYLKRNGRWQTVLTSHQPWKPAGAS